MKWFILIAICEFSYNKATVLNMRDRRIPPLSNMSKIQPEYFVNYLRHKQVIFSQLEQEVVDQAKRNGELISCHKDCAFCCVVYIEATLTECMAIVFYLLQNQDVLTSFLKQYPDWLRQTGPLADRCTKAINQVRKPDQSENVHRDLADALLFYRLQNAACPFLNHASCSIYPARPFSCASHFATSPPQWCSPLDLRTPRIYKGSFGDYIADLSLNAEQFNDTGPTLMPEKVYEILQAENIFTSK